MGCEAPTGVPDDTGLVEGTGQLQTVTATGVAYYVSSTGNDNSPGTSPSQAWRSIAKVNSMQFGPGDRVGFQGGATFTGTLYFDASDAGTALYPIIVTSYGTGRAVIDGGSGDAAFLYNTTGFEIRNLNVRGSGRTLNTGSGVNLYTDLGNGVKLDYIRIDSVEASGFGQYGIVIGSWNATTGYQNVRVTNASAHDNGLAGVLTYSQSPYAHQNFYFGHLQAFNNSGKPGLGYNNGSGIVIGGVAGGTIERSIAHDNGWLCDAAEGPVGIWAYDSDQIVVQYNESYRNRTRGTADGGGFDLDQNTKNSKLQYNYSHDNDGPGFLLAHAPNNFTHTGNVIRYNISENDGRKNSPGAITIFGRVTNTEIYNNSVFLKPSVSGSPLAILVWNPGIPANDVQGVHVRNNAVYTTSGLRLVQVDAGQLSGAIDLRFEGNNYYGGGYPSKIVWGTKTYYGLTQWRTQTGAEKLNGVAVGSELDPRWNRPGNGGTIGNADQLYRLTAYKLTSASPLINKGLNLVLLFGLSCGVTDFYSNSIPSGSGYDVGAHERS